MSEKIRKHIDDVLMKRAKVIEIMIKRSMPNWIKSSMDSSKGDKEKDATLSWILNNLGYKIILQPVSQTKEVITLMLGEVILDKITFELNLVNEKA